MKLKWLWIVLLVLMIMVVCGLIVSALGIGIYSFTGISSVTNSDESIVEQMFGGEGLRNPNISAETSEDKTFLVGREEITLVVENRFGDVVVSGKDTDEIFMSVVKTAWGITNEDATENLELLQYEVIESPGTFTIRVLEPSRTLNMPGSMDFKMDIPISTNVTINTQNGDLSASNVKGNVDLNTSFGNIEVRDLQEGELKAKTQNGNITLRGINIQDFPIEASSAFGDINIYQADANGLDLSITNGSMSLENIMISGEVELSNDFGNIGYRSGQATNLRINSTNGTITLNGVIVENLLIAHTDFGNLDLSKTLASEYDLLTKNGRIDLDGADQASIKAETDFGEIQMKNLVLAIVDLKTKNGTVQINGSLAQADHHILSDFGSITIRMPANQSIGCDLKTNFGSINSAFDLTLSGAIDEKHFVGKINDGGGLLTIETQNGNITLEKTTQVEEK
jgi:DUF4097 and DUF4098 domain-containing protein YvlB